RILWFRCHDSGPAFSGFNFTVLQNDHIPTILLYSNTTIMPTLLFIKISNTFQALIHYPAEYPKGVYDNFSQAGVKKLSS
ncbi:MAG: hypothetical protein KJP23_25120, partial [Deltaproteobacteria bacterium]|nr:hypothetical protein [Deltaproteobacteria bacterium]